MRNMMAHLLIFGILASLTTLSTMGVPSIHELISKEINDLIPTHLPIVLYRFYGNITSPNGKFYINPNPYSEPTSIPFKHTPSSNSSNSTKTVNASILSSAAQNYHDMSSVVLALDLLSTARAPQQIYDLCETFPARTLERIGFSDALVRDILCEKPLEAYIPVDPDDVGEVRMKWVTGMWLQQTFVALGGKIEMLCGMFDEGRAEGVFMNGTYARNVLCAGGQGIKGKKILFRPRASGTGGF